MTKENRNWKNVHLAIKYVSWVTGVWWYKHAALRTSYLLLPYFSIVRWFACVSYVMFFPDARVTKWILPELLARLVSHKSLWNYKLATSLPRWSNMAAKRCSLALWCRLVSGRLLLTFFAVVLLSQLNYILAISLYCNLLSKNSWSRILKECWLKKANEMPLIEWVEMVVMARCSYAWIRILAPHQTSRLVGEDRDLWFPQNCRCKEPANFVRVVIYVSGCQVKLAFVTFMKLSLKILYDQVVLRIYQAVRCSGIQLPVGGMNPLILLSQL